MATVQRARKSTKSVAAPVAAPNLVELRAAVFAALGKIAGKEYDRDDLTGGSKHSIDCLTVTAEIAGQRLTTTFAADVSVGHDSERATSVGATAADLLAYVIGQLAPAHRDAMLRDLPAIYAANGCALPITTAAQDAAEAALKSLRQEKRTAVRGAVKVDYRPAELAVTG